MRKAIVRTKYLDGSAGKRGLSLYRSCDLDVVSIPRCAHARFSVSGYQERMMCLSIMNLEKDTVFLSILPHLIHECEPLALPCLPQPFDGVACAPGKGQLVAAAK